jgi:hypothetical protein
VAYPILADETDLTDFPGAPFPAGKVLSACEAIRREAGWHIAPSVTETLTLDSEGGPLLVLPTLYLTAVTEVRDMTGSEPQVLTGWRLSRKGLLSGCWFPAGFSAVEVDVTHGYDACPPELFPVIADWTARRVMQESLGSRSVAYSADGDSPIASTLARFKLPSRP